MWNWECCSVCTYGPTEKWTSSEPDQLLDWRVSDSLILTDTGKKWKYSIISAESKSPWFCVTSADSVFLTQGFTLEVWVEFKVNLSYFLMNVCLLPPWVNASADMPCTELIDSSEVKRMLSWANNGCTWFPWFSRSIWMKQVFQTDLLQQLQYGVLCSVPAAQPELCYWGKCPSQPGEGL